MLDMRRVVGMNSVFMRMLVVVMLAMRVIIMGVFVPRLGGDRLGRSHRRRVRFRFRDRGFACGISRPLGTLRLVIVVLVVIMIVVIVRMVVIVTMPLVIVMGRILVMPSNILMMLGIVRMHLAGIG